MRVSIALHRDVPSIGGNQRDFECVYMNYNRQYADLDADGHCVVDIEFPVMGETVEGAPSFVESWVAKFWSLGICEGVPQDTGGEVLNYAPLYEPIPVCEGFIPKIRAVMKVNK